MVTDSIPIGARLLFALSGGRTGQAALALAGRWRSGERNPPGERDQARREKLQGLLRVAAGHPAYRHLQPALRESMAESTLEGALRRLPITTKNDLREIGRVLSGTRVPRGGRWSSTGGSTGEPLRVLKSFEALLSGQAAYLRGCGWFGAHPGMPRVYAKLGTRISLAGWLRLTLLRSAVVNPLEDAPEVVGAGMRRLGSTTTVFVEGYPSSLLKLAEVTGRQGWPVIRHVFSTGEMLFPEQRDSLARSLNARVSSYYGSNEVNGLAFECPEGSLHVAEEHVILEVVDDSGRPMIGEPGRVVVTDLDNHAMPLLRYDLGDLATMSERLCSCGRTLRVLSALHGRQQDALAGRNGRTLPAIFFAGHFRDLRAISKYQLIQRSHEDIELHYVSKAPGAEAEAQRIATTTAERLGEGIAVRIEKRSDIPPTARGKIRLVIGLGSGVASTPVAGRE